MNYDPVRLEVYKHLLTSIAEEMGLVLRRSAFSPNIKERRDFSCAVFNQEGRLVAQAAHIPVHLGSMPLSVAAAVEHFPDLSPGDVVALNDPYRGGTHLPDITLVSPVFVPGIQRAVGYVATRAHHADVGGSSPGSMAVANEIYQEGLVIPPVRLVREGTIDPDLLSLILANVRTPGERSGDLFAQVAANERGRMRMVEIFQRYGRDEIAGYMEGLIDYTRRFTRELLASLPDGSYSFTDYLDDAGHVRAASKRAAGVRDGIDDQSVPITVNITIEGDQAMIDFSGSAQQQKGSLNAVFAITLSAVFYTILCLLDEDVPANSGCLEPILVVAPEGSVVNCQMPAAVAAGNVETSQRIVDVLLGAFSQVCPHKIPAASQGTMNNVTIGGWDPVRERHFTYYETIAGGMGGRPGSKGPSGRHSHMTNTLNTPIEAFEYAYPLRVRCYEIRSASGGRGRFPGGDGIRRDIEALTTCQVNLLSERRVIPPYGLEGGEPGARGENFIIRDGEKVAIPGKGSFELDAGDILSIRTPGGGGWGLIT